MKKHYNFYCSIIGIMMLLVLWSPDLVKGQALGTADNPFRISDIDQLVSLSKQVNEGGSFYYNPNDGMYYNDDATGYIAIRNMAEGSYFKLAADIISNPGDVASCAGVKGSFKVWKMLGTMDHPFDGHFDGDHHTVSGFLVLNDASDGSGFFGAIANHAEIKNLGVVNSYIGGANSTGGIVGEALGGRIDSCFFTGTIVTSGNYTGGLVGQMSVGTEIFASYASATITTSGNQLGGIVGKILNSPQDCRLQNVYSSCILHGNFQYTGGIVGENLGSGTVFSNCYYDKQLIDCKVSPNANPMGIGTAMGTTEMANGTWAPAGFRATGSGNNQYPYISGFSLSDDAVLFSTVPLFLPAGTSLSNLSSVNTVTVGTVTGVSWTETERVGVGTFTSPTLSVTGQCYVVLKATKGSNSRSYVLQFDKTPYIGTTDNPFPIDNQTDLKNFRDGINNGISFNYKHFTVPALGANTSFIQTADIAMPSGNNVGNTTDKAFKGTYDGGNHKVTNMAKAGLFGYTENATVRNLTIQCTSAATSALINTMRGGMVDNCHAISAATSGNKAGLIYETAAGNYTCYIKKCTNRCNISGVSVKGGIVSQVGSDYNYIDSCHNYGSISSSSFVAGIVAQNTNNTLPKLYVTNCSNRGNITCTGGGENAAAGIVASLGGYRSHTSTATCDIQYCFNTGKITCNADRMAGILASYGTNHHVKYCYNLGELEAQGENNRQIRINGVSYAIDAQSCFNAGKITSTSTLSPLYAVAPNINTSTNFSGIACFNAGDLFSKMYEARALYPADGSSTSYNIGRIEGYASRIGGKYFDVTRVPSYANAILGGATAKTTTQLAATGVFSADKWVCEAGYYPRIKGLDTLTISRVLSMPIYFAEGDNVDHVTQNFTVRRGWGVKWIIKEGSGEATISDTISTDNNLQTVTLNTNRSYQNIVLAAQKGDSIYFTITLVQVPPTPARALTVTSLADLQALRNGINSNGPFVYKDTIVPAGAENTTFIVTQDFSISGESNWTPIGDGDYVFKGFFDGNNKTISGLKQTSKTYFGLFGNVSGTVKDLTLSEVSITGSTHGGALCYMLTKGGTLSNCKAEGKMSNVGVTSSSNTVYAYVGGLVARSYGGTITQCVNGMDIVSKDKTRVGGIVAYTDGSTSIEYCENAGDISNTFYIGGISGSGGIIKYCVNYGNITGTSMSAQIAGIGLTTSTITGCVNSGRIAVPLVSTTCYVAGVGYGGTIKSSYNVGEIVGNNAAATYGVGQTCQYCYNAAKVSGNTVYAVGSSCTKCFYDSQMTLLTDSKATAKTTVEMCALTSGDLGDGFIYEANMYPRVLQIATTPASLATAAPIFLANGEDVSMINNDFTYGGCAHNVEWTTNDTYSHTISSCSATLGNPGLPTDSAKINGVVYKVVSLNMKMDSYVIKDATELAHFRDGINSGIPFYYHPGRQVFSTQDTLTGGMQVPAYGLDATFKVLNNIDLSNELWTPIGKSSAQFKGVFNGNGKTIRNFKVNTASYSGLFGNVNGAVIENLVIEDANGTDITGSYIGVLAGYMTATTVDSVYINNCSIASTNSSGLIGGLAGQVVDTKISRVHVSGSSISGTTNVGGVLGKTTSGGITNCSVTNTTVHGSGNYIGGLVGTITTNGSSIYVTNVTMENNNVDGKSYVAGLIAATSRGNGTQILNNIKVLGGTVAGISSVAGVVAQMCNSQYTNLYCSATVTGTGDKVAGIVANGNGGMTGTQWVFTGTVSGKQYVGGLIGYPDAANDNQDIKLSNSINAGTVTGTNYVGGIRGREYHTPSNLTVSCINIGNVTGNMWVGGIVGYSQGNSYYCMNAGIVTGSQYVGGIVGHQSNYTAYNCKAHDCVSVGQVYGTANVGNVAGYYESGTVEKCYYDKQVSPDYMGIGSVDRDVAGAAEGKNTSEMLNTTLSLTGFTAATELYPRTTTLKDSVAALVAASPVNLENDKTAYTIPGEATYIFTPSTENGVVWTCEETSLRNTGGTFSPKAAGGDVLTATKGDFSKHVNVTVGISKEFPCIIKNQAELAKFTQYVNSGNTFYYNTSASTTDPESFSSTEPENFLTGIKINPGGADAFFKLADDFDPDFQTETWAGRIGTTNQPFLGEFNGSGRTVSNLPSGDTDSCGFFGVNKGVVYDLTIENPNMTDASRNKVGALCGYNEGTITNCHVVNGTVSGAQYVGGLVGLNKGYIEDCHNSSTVNGMQYVGGIAGNSTKSITRCFNLGDITASGTTNTYLGGVVGESGNGSLTYCYNAGRITATGSSSKNVGGVVGNINSGGDIASCYNIGEVTAPTANNTGAIAGTSGKSLVTSMAYDNQMCTVAGAYGSGNGNATTAATSAMLGTSLQSVLGNDGTWTYTDGLYPRLTSMKDMEASIAAATPMNLSLGENVGNVEHEFTVSTDNSVEWSVEPATGVLDMSNFPTINFIRCGAPELSVKQGTAGKELKKIKISINYTASVVEYDTACGGSFYTWPVNNIDYYATNDVVFNTTEAGCPVTHILHVTVPAVLAAEVTPVDQQCYNTNTGKATATVTGGFGVYSYSWKDEHGTEVSTSNPATGLAPGTYSLTVTDGKPVPKEAGDEYCTVVVDNIVINPVTELVARIDTFSAGCYNSVDGMFQISVDGGVAPYTLSWKKDGVDAGSRYLNTPQDNYEVNNLANGTYEIKVTDANGCIKTDGLTINLNDNASVYKITAFSGNKTYDGEAMHAGKFDLKIGSAEAVSYLSGNSITLTGGDVLTATVEQGDLTAAGEYSNSVTSYSVTRNGQDVTCLYNIQVEHGTVSIAKRQVTITSADSMAYMPISTTCLTRHQVTVTGDGFTTADAAGITYNFSGQICGATTSTTTPNTFEVVGNNEILKNYDLTLNFGTLTLVELGKIVVTAMSLEKTYDGVTVTYGQDKYNIAAYTVIENAGGSGLNDTIFYNTPDKTTLVVNGHTYTVEVVLNNGSDITITDAGTVDNVVTSVNVYSGSADVTSAFTAGQDLRNGLLKVNPIDITLTSYSDTVTYDAQPHSRPGVSVEGAFLPADISVAPVADRTETDAGIYPNTITYTTSTSFKPQNYNIQENVGNLVIKKRPLYLEGVDKLVDYQSGVDQSTDVFTYGNLVAGHTASGISYLAHGESVGDHTGEFSGTLLVKDASDNNVTDNYEPVEQPGILGIQSPNALLKIKSATQSRMYDGTAFTAQTYEVNYKGVRVNPLATDPHRFRLSSGDTVEVIPVGTGVTGRTDVGSVKNSFTHQIHPIANHDMYTNLEGDTGMVSVTKRPVTLTSNALTRSYDGTDIVSEGVAVSGSQFVDGEGATYTYEAFAAGSRTNVGTYANKFDYALNAGTNADNYDIDTVYGKLIVTPAELTVKAEDKIRPYGDENAFTYTITGYQNGEDESVITAGLNAVTYTCDGDQFANIGQYTITPVVDALESQNYSFTTATGTLTVQKRQMTVTANSITVAYDGTAHNQTTNPPTIAEYTNIADGDVANATLSYQRTAGGEQPMTVSSVTITRNNGARDVTGNYNVVANENSKLVITKRDLKLIVTDAEKPYDGTALKATAYTVDPSTPLPENDVISNVQYTGEQLTPGTSASSIATGNIRITNSVINQEVQSNSYNIIIVNGNLTVTDHEMVLTMPTTEQSTKTYDATALQPTAMVSGLLAGTTATIEYSTDNGAHWSTTAPSRTDVGSTLVQVRATAQYHETKTGEYTLTVNSATLTIAAKPQTYTYNGQAQGPAGTYTSDFDTYVTVTGLQGSDALTSVVLSGSKTNQGTYTGEIVPSAAEIGTKTDNYSIAYTEATLTINKVALTITAIDQSYTYNGVAQGENNATYTTASDIAAKVTVEGLQGNDALTSIKLNGQETNKGVYELKIEPSDAAIGTATDNYTITYKNGKLTINKADLTITAVDQTYTYNGSAQGEDNATYSDAAVIATKVSVEGLQGNDALTSIKLNGNETDQGVYANHIVPSAAVVKNGGTDVTDNYTIIYNNGKLTINQATLTIKLDTAKEYDGTEFVSELTEATNGRTNGYIISGLQNGAKLSGEVTSSAKDVGIYIDSAATNAATVTLEFQTNDGINNYIVVYDFTQEITAAPLTLKLDTAKDYDGLAFVSDYAATTDGWTVTGLKNNATLTAGKVTSKSKDAATYTYSGTTDPTSNDDMTIATAFATSDGITNYSVTYDFKQVIRKKNLEIVINDTKEYDGTALVTEYGEATAAALQNGATLTAGAVTTASKDVNTYSYSGTAAPTANDGMTITTAFETSDGIGNYDVSYNFTQEITAAPLTLKLDTAKDYDGLAFVSDYAATTDGWTVTGLKNNATLTAGVVTSKSKDAATYTYSGTAAPTSNDDMTITTAFATSDGITNYSVTYDFKQVIRKKNLEIVINDTKEYDGTALVTEYGEATAAALQNNATLTAGEVTTASKDVNTYSYSGTTAPTANDGMTITTAFETSDGIGNYDVSYNFTQEITAAPLTLKLDTAKDYDGLAFVSDYAATTDGWTVTGLKNNATLTAGKVTSKSKDAATYTYSGTTDPTSNDDMTITTAFATSDGITNYTVTYDFKQVIRKKNLEIVINDTKEYDGTPLVTSYNAGSPAITAAALQNNATLTAGEVTTASKDVNTYSYSGTAAPTSNDGMTITTAFATSDDINNYNVSYNFTQVITAAPLTLKLDTAKDYDGLAFVSDYAATTDGWTVTGLKNNATLTAGKVTSKSKDAATYTYSGTTVPTSNDDMTITTAFATSDGITNYSVTYDFKQVIRKKNLEIVINDTKEYDGTALVTEYGEATAANLQNGATLTAGEVTTASKDVNTYSYSGTAAPTANDGMTITTAFATSDDINNYNVSYNFTQVITAAPLTITLDTAKIYDGFQFVSTLTNASNGRTNGYTISGLQNNATVSGVVTSQYKDVATYIDSVATNYASITTDFTTSDDITNYTVVYDFKQVILPLSGVEVTLKENGGITHYDGYLQQAKGYTIVSYSSSLYTSADFRFKASAPASDTIVAGRYAGTYYMELKGEDFENINTNFIDVVFTIVDSSLVINPNPTPITVTASSASKPYDGTPLTSPGYSYTQGVLATGDTLVATVTGSITDFGTVDNVVTEYKVFRNESYNPLMMRDGLSAAVIAPAGYDTNITYSYTFTQPAVQTGTLEITPNGNVSVKITGNHGEYNYDGSEHSVHGYVVQITDTLGIYAVGDISFTGDSTLDETAVGDYQMNLAISQFTNTNANYNPVSFEVLEDGWMKIYETLAVTKVDTDSVSCYGLNDGTATITVSGGKPADPGTPRYTYEVVGVNTHDTYSGGTDDNDQFSLTGLKPDRYEVTITDLLTYTVDTAFSIGQPDTLVVEAVTPTGHCPNSDYYDVSLTTSGGNGGNHYVWGLDATDADATSTVVARQLANDCGTTYTVAVKVTDRKGCEATDTTSFTVEDNEKPEADMPADLTLCRNSSTGAIEAPTDVTGVPSNLSDNCTGANTLTVSRVDIDTTGTDSGPRIIHRQWTVTDQCGNDSVKVQEITVRPSILTPGNYDFSCPSNIDVTLFYNRCDTVLDLGTPTAVNHMTDMAVTVTNDAPAGNVFTEGTTTVTWTATDECGAYLTCTQTIVVSYPPCGTVADSVEDYDHIKYSSVRIGCQCWTGENLRSTHYTDGADVANYHNYNNDPAYDAEYGKLYSWYSASRVAEGDDNATAATVSGPTGPYVQGICPDGWALPSSDDYRTLFTTAGLVDYLKDTDPQYWLPGAAGITPSTGFDARGAGILDSDIHRYMNLLGETYYWTSELAPTTVKGHCAVITYYCPEGIIQEQMKGHGQSVRCIRMQ